MYLWIKEGRSDRLLRLVTADSVGKDPIAVKEWRPKAEDSANQ